MNSTVIKLAAVGIGGYLAWPYLQRAMSQGTSPAPGPTTTPAVHQAPTMPAVTPASAPTPPAVAPPPATHPEANDPTDAHWKKAAAWKGWAHLTGALKQDWHHWMWYRARYNDSLIRPTSESVGQGDGTGLLTAAEFHAVLSAHQLAGLAFWHARGSW